MHKTWLLIGVLGVSCAAGAQGKAASWENLNSLAAGQRIQVRTMESKKVTGAFLSVSGAAISLQADSGSRTIEKADVRSVVLGRNRHRLRNALILGGVGAGVGAGIGLVTHHGCSATQAFCLDIGGQSLAAGIGATIGFIGGTAAGALLPDHATVYSVSGH